MAEMVVYLAWGLGVSGLFSRNEGPEKGGERRVESGPRAEESCMLGSLYASHGTSRSLVEQAQWVHGLLHRSLPGNERARHIGDVGPKGGRWRKAQHVQRGNVVGLVGELTREVDSKSETSRKLRTWKRISFGRTVMAAGESGRVAGAMARGAIRRDGS